MHPPVSPSNEPPPSSDDTRPTGLMRVRVTALSDTEPIGSFSDTRPLTTTHRRALRQNRRRRLTLVLFASFIASLIFTLLVGGILIVLMRPDAPRPALSVILWVDQRTYTLMTQATTVGELLTEQGIILGAESVVSPSQATALTDGMRVVISLERTVTVTIDGQTSVFRTVFDHPLDILTNIGFFVDEHDLVWVNGNRVNVADLEQYPLPADEITVKNALPITIMADGETRTLQTTATTVGDALAEAAITLYLADRVTPPVDLPIEANLTISVERSRPITITVDGMTLESRTLSATVGEALIEAGIALNGLDYAIPPELAAVPSNGTIRVVRVTEVIETEQSPVPFEVVYQADGTLELDTQAVTQTGVAGTQQRNLRVRYEEGVEVSRIDEGTTITQPPINQVINYGTLIVLRTIDTPEGPREYWRKLRVYATSYHPAALGGDDVTATGRKLQKGIVAIDPKLIPYSTQVYIEGYGVGLAADTGGARATPYWIDLGFSDSDFERWTRWVDVYLLTPVPARYPLILPAFGYPAVR